MPYRAFGNGYSFLGDDGRPDFVSIDNTPQGLPQIFSGGVPVNPVDQHAQFAQDAYAGRAQAPGISQAIGALAQMRNQEEQSAVAALPGLMRDYNPRGPVGYGTIGNDVYVGGNKLAGGMDALQSMRQQQAARTMGELNRTNAEGTVPAFFADQRVSGFSPEMLEKVHDTIWGQGSLRRKILADQLAQQRAATDPNGYTPVTGRDVDQFQQSQSPAYIKAASEKLAAVKSQYGISALDLLHSIGAKNMANLPATKDKSGIETMPARSVFMHPNEQSAIRSALNAAIGQGSYPSPDSGEMAELQALHAKAMGVAPAAAQQVAAAAAPAIDPTISPLHQTLRNAGNAIGLQNAGRNLVEQPYSGMTRNIGNIPIWLWNHLFAAQNNQSAYLPKNPQTGWGSEETPLY